MYTLLSFFGRVNYSFKDRYLLEANVRADGSSRFADGKRWGVFPSVSVGWRVSEEAFWKDAAIASWFDNLKSKYWSAAAAIGLMAVLAVASYFIGSSRSDIGDEFVHISVPYGQTKFLCLEDSTRVTINAGTTLIYPRRFGKGKRNVFLSGEANFDVTRDEKRPFTVETQSIKMPNSCIGNAKAMK